MLFVCELMKLSFNRSRGSVDVVCLSRHISGLNCDQYLFVAILALDFAPVPKVHALWYLKIFNHRYLHTRWYIGEAVPESVLFWFGMYVR